MLIVQRPVSLRVVCTVNVMLVPLQAVANGVAPPLGGNRSMHGDTLPLGRVAVMMICSPIVPWNRNTSLSPSGEMLHVIRSPYVISSSVGSVSHARPSTAACAATGSKVPARRTGKRLARDGMVKTAETTRRCTESTAGTGARGHRGVRRTVGLVPLRLSPMGRKVVNWTLVGDGCVWPVE